MKFSLSMIAAFGVLLASLLSAAGATFSVINTADSGLGSLRQAVTDSNANPPPPQTTNLIQFAIPGTGVQTIALASVLTISEPVTIDGYTQPGASANTLTIGDNAVLLVRIDPGSNNVFFLGNGSDGSTIRGLAIVNGGAIFDIRSSNNIIAGNFAGVDTDGKTFAGSPSGVVSVTTGVSSNLIGGATVAARNVMAATGNIVEIGGDKTTVQGNYLNLSAAGDAALGSPQSVVEVGAGDGAMILNNVLGTWKANGINIGQQNLFFPLTNVTVQGNFIGTDATGKVGLTDGLSGITIGNATTVTIGGSASGAGNVIAHASNGIIFTGTTPGTAIQGNLIGTDVTGRKKIGNSFNGIDIGGSTTSGLIGGTSPGEGNVIAFNGTNGIVMRNGNTGWSLLGNAIFSNTGVGISLGGREDLADTPTPNDPGDADTGANNLQNYPVLHSLTNDSGHTTVTGTLNSVPNGTFRIELFGSDQADASGFGEGQTFLGSVNVSTDANGDGSFSVTVPQIDPKQRVTATATDAAGNTSEFSGAIGQLLNISTRMEVLTNDNVLIGGFIVVGSNNMNVLLRAIGPSLGGPPFNISGALADPILELHDHSGATIATNDNWKDTQEPQIEATGIPPSNDLESAMVQNLAPGAYTAIVRGEDNGTGVGLVEAYDLDAANATRLANISTRGFVDTGDNVMIGGFIAGNGITRVLARAIGPSLPVSGTLADPMLELHNGNGDTIASNDDWKQTQQAEITATGIPPANDLESALIQTLTPGNYTAVVRGKNSGTGIALVELYNVQ